MPGRAKSQVAKHYAELDAARKHENRAVTAYNSELEVYVKGAGPKPSYRGVARRFGLDYRLLQRRQKGIGHSKQESNASRSHMTPTEALELIDFTIEMARRTFPLHLDDLERHALEI